MTIKRVFIDRSRILERQRCPRKRFLTYHEGAAGVGIEASRKPLALAVGGSVHAGLASLLMNASDLENQSGAFQIEEDAVQIALADFQRFADRLDLDASEQAGLAPSAEVIRQNAEMIAQAVELGMPTDGLGVDHAQSKSEFDRYLFAEQSALVEGLVRAYARRRLRPLLEQYEVLEVEREGEWKLDEWTGVGEHDWYSPSDDPTSPWYDSCSKCSAIRNSKAGMGSCRYGKTELWFMSRSDALLRDRQTNELHILSYKTTGAWDVRKARDIEHDMQGLSEGVEVERRLGEWWERLHTSGVDVPEELKKAHQKSGSRTMYNFLMELPAPPRIAAIRYEFLLKGERWKDKELGARLGMEVRSQKSHLIRQYVATSVPKKGDSGYRIGDVCWSWDFYRTEDDKDGSLAWQNWKSRAVFAMHGLSMAQEAADVRRWIDLLDQSTLTMSGEDSTLGIEPRALGWHSPAQAMGVTRVHPLDAVFVPPVVIYRNDDDLRDWAEETAASERETAEHVAEVQATADPGERRSLLNRYFPKHRQSCEYPGTCTFARDRVGVCWAGAEMQADPVGMGGGEYRERTPNHPMEAIGTQSLVQIENKSHNLNILTPFVGRNNILFAIEK